MSEHSEHSAVCLYLKLKYPRTIFCSDGSGVKLPMGLAKKVKGLKSSRGIPDLIIFEPRGAHHGLMIEMKASGTVIYNKDGRLRKDKHLEEQARVLTALNTRGYRAVFAVGSQQAIEYIDQYMKL